MGRSAYPDAELRNADIDDFDPSERFDLVVLASGIFNGVLEHEEQWARIERTLARMFELTGFACAADFMSGYVDYNREDTFHAEPERVFSLAKGLRAAGSPSTTSTSRSNSRFGSFATTRFTKELGSRRCHWNRLRELASHQCARVILSGSWSSKPSLRRPPSGMRRDYTCSKTFRAFWRTKPRSRTSASDSPIANVYSIKEPFEEEPLLRAREYLAQGWAELTSDLLQDRSRLPQLPPHHRSRSAL